MRRRLPSSSRSRAKRPTRLRRCANRRRSGSKSVAICNVVGSMATREADGTIYTHAGPEIGVASTKAFTCQLVALAPARDVSRPGARHAQRRRTGASTSRELSGCRSSSNRFCICPNRSKSSPARFHNRTDFLYLGRGINYPIALEGALKLKEISYIHAEGYPAGEMKHGPIALIDERMPSSRIAPSDHGLREDARQHSGSQSPRRSGDRDHHGGRRHAVAAPRWQYRLDHLSSCDAARAHTDRNRACPCNFLRTTSPCAAAATSISRAISRRASR